MHASAAPASLRTALARARHVLAITGAGISAESGVPTFRGPGGYWRDVDPMTIATPEAFARDPRFVWEWYDSRRVGIAAALPNPAHRALADWEHHGARVTIVTQNVDDLHERAGSSGVIHVHGSIWQVRCTTEGTVSQDRRAPLPELPPRCACGALLRPGVVWFGELLPADEIARIEGLLEHDPPDVALVIGTEATFGYIVDWALRAHGAGAWLAEVNVGATDFTGVIAALGERAVHLRGRAGEVLPALRD